MHMGAYPGCNFHTTIIELLPQSNMVHECLPGSAWVLAQDTTVLVMLKNLQILPRINAFMHILFIALSQSSA